MTTKAQRDGVLAVLAAAATYPTRDDLIDALIQAALVGDVTTRYCVIVRNPGSDYTVFGPYASPATAQKAINSGALAHREGARGAIYGMTPQPRTVKKKASSTK